MPDLSLQAAVNLMAGTTGLGLDAACNRLAGTTGLAAVAALNVAAGTRGLDLQGALNALAGTSGLAPQKAASFASFPKQISGLAAWYDARFPYGYSETPNLLTANQASVETDLSGLFALDGSPTIVRSTAQALYGAASVSVTSTAVGLALVSTSPSGSLLGTAPATAGAVYTASASLRAATTTRTGSIYLVFKNSAGTNIGLVNATASVTSSA